MKIYLLFVKVESGDQGIRVVNQGAVQEASPAYPFGARIRVMRSSGAATAGFITAFVKGLYEIELDLLNSVHRVFLRIPSALGDDGSVCIAP